MDSGFNSFLSLHIQSPPGNRWAQNWPRRALASTASSNKNFKHNLSCCLLYQFCQSLLFRYSTFIWLQHCLDERKSIILPPSQEWETLMPPREYSGFPGSSAGKECICNTEDPGLIPGLGRFPGEGIDYLLQYSWASLVTQIVKNLPAMQETWVQSLGWEYPLEEGMATHSSILT